MAKKWGVRTVLWFNLVPRVVMSAWAIIVGMCRSKKIYSLDRMVDLYLNYVRTLSTPLTYQGHSCKSDLQRLGR